MDDLISRQAVGDALNGIEISRNASWYEFYQKALTAVGELPSAQPKDECEYWDSESSFCALHRPSAQPGWIPVTERLPEEDTEVLVTVYFMGLKQTSPNGWNVHIRPNYYVDFASRIGNEWSSASDEYKVARDRHKVVAWQPKPKPWKGGQDG